MKTKIKRSDSIPYQNYPELKKKRFFATLKMARIYKNADTELPHSLRFYLHTFRLSFDWGVDSLYFAQREARYLELIGKS